MSIAAADDLESAVRNAHVENVESSDDQTQG
jgi:hypothetical protein